MEKALKSESKPATSRDWNERVLEIQDLDFPLLKIA